MSKLKIWNWDKKKRTLLRFIKVGDIFCFRIDENKYGFGRIIAILMKMHIAEILDFISDEPVITQENIASAKRLLEPMALDSYALFDRKRDGDWRIIGHELDFELLDAENIYFAYGVGNGCKKINILGCKSAIKESEKNKYIKCVIRGDSDIKNAIKNQLSQNK